MIVSGALIRSREGAHMMIIYWLLITTVLGLVGFVIPMAYGVVFGPVSP